MFCALRLSGRHASLAVMRNGINKLSILLLALFTVNLPFARCLIASAGPRPDTVRAFQKYVQSVEVHVNADCEPDGAFLWIDRALDDSARLRAKEQLKSGQVLAQCVAGCDSGGVPIPGGLIHDWVGVVFVPGVSLPQTLSLVQDYGHAQNYYRPDVTRSKLLFRSGNSFQVFLQLKQTDVLTVVFNTEYRILYIPLSASRACSISHSVRIAEVANAGGAQEHEKNPDSNSGFLWRLDSYWRFEEADGGVYIQCRVISLTRDIPPGLNWAVAPFIKNIPGKSLRFTLGATREALLRKFPAAR